MCVKARSKAGGELCNVTKTPRCTDQDPFPAILRTGNILSNAKLAPGYRSWHTKC